MQHTASHPEFPLGLADSWYVVAFSDELAAEDIRTLHYFGEQLALFRDSAGKAALVDAFCGHMGACLGADAGARIENGELVCPFHNWRWNGAGECVAIPYAKRIPDKARIRSYPVRERGGVIWAWYSAQQHLPAFDIPEVPEFDFPGWGCSWMTRDWHLKTHNQELFENGIDWGHFHYVHGFTVPESKTVSFDDHLLNWTVSTHSSEDSDEPYVIRNTVVGLGFGLLRNRENTLMLFSGTPVDKETVHVRMSVNCSDDLSAPSNRQALQKYAAWQAESLAQDFHIWEKKIYRPEPVLCDGDGPITKYRRWARQFYALAPAQL